ncbi:Uncharacterized protein YnbD [Coccomyxa sp. Obi]|nr:Uncharacterized protein YnbD [Coccomyxa sp. Obi]
MLSTVVGTSTIIPATLAFFGRKHFPLPVTLILAHVAASGFVVAIAATDTFASSSTFLLGKQPSGKISWWGWALFWPYHVALRTKLWVQRQTRVEPVWDHITDGWYLGGWPASAKMLPEGEPAILDCTCELPRIQRHLPYDNLPIWDTHGPSVKQIDEGVKWALGQKESGRPVLVHCAHGHGRSLVVMCAILVVSGRAGDFLEAYKMVKAARPKVRLNSRQHKALVQWQEHMKDRKKAT